MAAAQLEHMVPGRGHDTDGVATVAAYHHSGVTVVSQWYSSGGGDILVI